MITSANNLRNPKVASGDCKYCFRLQWFITFALLNTLGLLYELICGWQEDLLRLAPPPPSSPIKKNCFINFNSLNKNRYIVHKYSCLWSPIVADVAVIFTAVVTTSSLTIDIAEFDQSALWLSLWYIHTQTFMYLMRASDRMGPPVYDINHGHGHGHHQPHEMTDCSFVFIYI